MVNSGDGHGRFTEQSKFLRESISRDGAYIGVLASLAVFLFSLFLSWTQATSFADLEDKGYTTGWSELGYLSLLPIGWAIYCVVRSIPLKPKTVVILAICSFVTLVTVNVLGRSEWMYKEYTTTMGNFGGSWRNYTGRNHNAGSDLGFGFWSGLVTLSAISLFPLVWTLHKQGELIKEGMVGKQAVVPDTQPELSPELPAVPASGIEQAAPEPLATLSPYERLNELARLKDKGVITGDEFQNQKAVILGYKNKSPTSSRIALIMSLITAVLSVAALAYLVITRNDENIVANRSDDAGVTTASSPVDEAGNTQSLQTLSESTPLPSDASQVENAGSESTLARVGECKATLIASISNRLDGEPDSGSAISYSDGTYGVSYETVPGVVNSQVDDPVKICLESVPQNCPAGDDRGRVYRATNLRTNESWSLPDSSHSCGGA